MHHCLDLRFAGQDHTIAAYLLESSEGPVLVETGPYSCFPALEKALAERGYLPQDVRHVFLTHIHLDHAGAAWAFARHGAKIYVHPKGAPHLNNPERLLLSARRIYKDQMEQLWGALHGIPQDRLEVVREGQRVRVGNLRLKALFTPGHAVHHIAWQWEDALFAGDVAGIRIRNGIVLPPCPPPDIDIEAWERSLETIREKRFQRLFLAHFGEVTDVREHIRELRTRLRNWALWMKPFAESHTPSEEIIPRFEQYVQTQLEAFGIQGDSLIRYQMANPPWMSVHGLLRYWQKKLQKSSKETNVPQD